MTFPLGSLSLLLVALLHTRANFFRRFSLLRNSRSPTALDTLVRGVWGLAPQLGHRERSSRYSRVLASGLYR